MDVGGIPPTMRSVRRKTLALSTVVACLLSVGATVPALAAPTADTTPKPSPGRAVSGVKPTKFRFTAPPDAAKETHRPQATRWPQAATAALSLLGADGKPAKKARAAGTPVWARPVTAQDGYDGPAQADVQVLDQKAARAADVAGVLVKVTPKDGGADRVRIGVDYAAFADGYGGNYGSRLRLMRMPACALTTPEVAACRTPTPLASTNDTTAHAVSAEVTLTGQPAAASRSAAPADAPLVLAAMAGGGTGGAEGGTYAATDLKPSGSWTGGGSTGSFTYNYPITLPPATGGLTPTVSLSYDSGSVDGQTVSTQAQASWVGDGWSTPRSFIEHSFTACRDKPQGKESPKKTDDLCYNGPTLTMSLNGSSSKLVYDATKKVWRPENDNGETLTHVTDPAVKNDLGHWVVTTRDGLVYRFGLNKLPGWDANKPTTNSVDTVPVYSPHAGDPCYSAEGFDKSVCTTARRWNLDYVTDVHGNAMAYYYKQYTNYYGRNEGDTMAPYVRDSHLDHIDYGFRAGGAYGTVANKVVFTTGDRCIEGTCQPLNASTKANWPDVPYDLMCAKDATCESWSPSFFSTVRLASITTRQYSTTASTHVPVDSYALDQSMPATGDGNSPTLWLKSITRTGHDTTAGGSTSAITLPSVSFTSTKLPNRAFYTDALHSFYRHRIQTVTTETGSVITVGYELPQPCSTSANTAANADTNTTSCYPVYWTPDGYTEPILDWFRKYAVTRVTATDPTGGAPATATSYAYLGGAAWHYDENESVKAKHRTYGEFRGYRTVQTFTGDGEMDRRTKNETTYYRGMSGDRGRGAVTVTDSLGGVHDDHDKLAGSALETTAYQGDGGPVDSSTITAYWVSAPTATRARVALPDLSAARVEPALILNRQRLTSGGQTRWRYQQTDNSYDATISSPTFGVLKASYSHTVPANPAYDRCTTNSYAPTSDASPLVGLVALTETVAVACGGFQQGTPASVPANYNKLTTPAAVSRPDQVVSQKRFFYDDPDWSGAFPQTTAPRRGLVTMTQVAKGYDTARGAHTYQNEGRATYDEYGRVRNAYDGNDNLTDTSYTTNSIGLTTGVTVKKPLGHTLASTISPMRGLTLTSTDINNVVTTQHHDALGRITAVWLNNRATTAPAQYKFAYTISKTGISATTTERANDANGYLKTVTLYDAQLRQRQTQTMTPQSGRLIADTFYDTRGWVTESYNGWWDPKTTPTVGAPVHAENLQVKVPNQTFTKFDGLGRAIIVEQAENGRTRSTTTTVYNGDEVTVIPPAGGTATTTVTDPIGRLDRMIQYKARPRAIAPADTFTGTFTIDAPVAAGDDPIVTTRYGYDARGNQNSVTDAGGNTWTTTYNLLGQVTSKKDPDAGETTGMTYDGNGNLLQSTDGNGTTTSSTYDDLNRPTGSYAAATEAQSSTNQLTAMVYDNSDNAIASMTHSKGHLTAATSYQGGHAYKFQARGFTVFGTSIGETVTIPAAEGALAGTYSVAHQYSTNNGLLLKDVYPAKGGLPSETVQHLYDAFDTPDTLGGLNGYTQQVMQDAYGRIVQQTIGSAPNQALVTNQYDEHNGLLTQQLVTRTPTTPGNVDQQNYKYDEVGNLLRQTSVRHAANGIGETQCFTYDELRRLTEAWTATDNCATAPTPGNRSMVGNTIGGGSAYWTRWTFDNLGNRKTEVEHSLSGGADTTTSYTYNGNGAGQPHTLTATSTTGGRTGSTSYTYDKAGNTKTRNPGTGAQTLTWTATGKLASATTSKGTSTNIYGPNGDLLLQKDPGTTTLYIGSQQWALNTNTNTITGTRYYALPGGGTAIRTAGSYTFALPDRHGTPSLYLDNTAQKPTWRQYTVYGGTRGATITLPDNRGFLDKTVNASTGLIHVGARQYDPAIGRFISVDPLQDLTDPQQWNGYAYANNNPTTYSDPTGLMGDTGNGSGNGNTFNPTTGDVLSGGKPGDNVYDGTDRDDDKPVVSVTNNNDDGSIEIAGGITVDAYNVSNFGTYLRMVNEAYAGLSADMEDTLRVLVAMTLACQSVDTVCTSMYTHQVAGAAATRAQYNQGCRGACLERYEGIVAALEDSMMRGATRLSGAGRATKSLKRLGRGEGDVCLGGANSFSADTLVLMADGTTKPFSELRVGDKVLATDPETGEEGPREIEAVWVHDDHLYELTIDGKRIVTTEDHPFWNETGRSWQDADELDRGDLIRTTAGVARVTGFDASARRYEKAYNLTVADIHTYYVLAGNTPVLVHNCGGYDLRGKDPMSIVPDNASVRELTPHPNGGSQYGLEFKWTNDAGKTVRLRIHGPDGTAPAGSNSATGETYRVQIGHQYQDEAGNLFHHQSHNPNSPNYNPDAANATHIPWPSQFPGL